MKILHLAAYNRNIGDSIAIENIRKQFPTYEWKGVDIQSGSATKKILEQDYDILLIGGGGLIEGGGWNKTKWGWKLPFNQTEIKMIKKPMVVFAVGLNFFRGLEQLTNVGRDNLNTLIERSYLFSVRNDFSGSLIKQYYDGDKVHIIPDPGVIQSDVEQREVLTKILFSPALNKNPNIMKHRNINNKQILKVQELFRCDCIAHTEKDFLAGLKQVIKLKELSENKFTGAFFDVYDNYHLVIAMRGHAQLVAYGKGIPCIALSSQKKLTGFYKNVGMDEYIVDTESKNWIDLLKNKVKQLQDNPQKWYDIRNKYINSLRQDFFEFCNKIKELENG